MGLINCPECGKEIPSTAPSCIHCGKQINICPPSHLAKAIIVTILCCWPLGIPAIVYASEVITALINGQNERAEQMSKKANKWANIAIGCGIAFWVIYIGFIFFAGIASALLNRV